MFSLFIVQPLFNLLVLVYALLPSNNFGLALIIFTVIIRMLLWPLMKKQLHQAKMMKKLQPELKKIKKAAKGDRQKESVMMMELYKERGISPFGTLPVLIFQLIVFIGLYSGINKIVHDPHTIVSFAYPAIQNLSWIQELSQNIKLFDNTLLGFIDLNRSASSSAGIYLPALIIVLASGYVQFLQGRQLLPSSKDQKSLRTILKEAGAGKQADQSDVSAAVGKSTVYFLPFLIIITTVHFASALALYWLVSGLVGYIQQSIILKDDEEEMDELASEKPTKKNVKKIPEAEVVSTPTAKKPTKKKSKSKKRK